MSTVHTKAEFQIFSPTLYAAWQAPVRYIAPVAVFIVMLNAISLF